MSPAARLAPPDFAASAKELTEMAARRAEVLTMRKQADELEAKVQRAETALKALGLPLPGAQIKPVIMPGKKRPKTSGKANGTPVGELCRRALAGASKPLTAGEVLSEVRRTKPNQDESYVRVALKRGVQRGHLVEAHGEEGYLVYSLAPPAS